MADPSMEVILLDFDENDLTWPCVTSEPRLQKPKPYIRLDIASCSNSRRREIIPKRRVRESPCQI